jgi:uncharacterized protein YacL
MEGCLGIIIGLIVAAGVWFLLAFIGIPFWLSFFLAFGGWCYFVFWIFNTIRKY